MPFSKIPNVELQFYGSLPVLIPVTVMLFISIQPILALIVIPIYAYAWITWEKLKPVNATINQENTIELKKSYERSLFQVFIIVAIFMYAITAWMEPIHF